MLKRYAKDESGGAFIIGAFAIVLLVIVSGMGIDLGQSLIIKHKMHQASDAAALAGVQDYDTLDASNREAFIKRYFQLNFADHYMGSKISVDDVKISYLPDIQKPDSVNIKLASDVDTAFMRLAGIEKLNISTETEVASNLASELDLDLVMVLDGTGSMNLGNKLENMKTAADWLVNHYLIPENPKVRVGLVQFSARGFARRDRIQERIMPVDAAQKEALTTVITKMNGNGQTNGGEGAQAGDEMLQGLPPRALDGETGAVKAMIFLTDGLFNAPNERDAFQQFAQACDNIKSRGGVIYTIRYGTGAVDASLIKYMTDCANKPEQALYAPAPEDLLELFEQISFGLGQLRIVK